MMEPKMKWECKVKVNGIPTVMTTFAENVLIARNYFQKFGELLNSPRLI